MSGSACSRARRNVQAHGRRIERARGAELRAEELRRRRRSRARCASPAPSSSIAAVMLATPNAPAGSSALPAWTTRLICTSGTSCGSRSKTRRPFVSPPSRSRATSSRAGGPSARRRGAVGRFRPAAASGAKTATGVARIGALHGFTSGSTTSSTRRSSGNHARRPPARRPASERCSARDPRRKSPVRRRRRNTR